MEIRSPPPPSPTASEPPPSYDSLTPTSRHPPYLCLPTTTNQGFLPPAQHLQHESPWAPPGLHHEPLQAPRLRQEASALQQLQPTSGQQHELMTITEEELHYPPPPPYSPGLRNILGVSCNHQNEGRTEAPPSYYSLFGQIQHARQQTSNNVAFLKKLCNIILSTIGCTFLLVMLMFIPLTILVLGIVYVNQCPLQPLVPIFLIIGGLSGVIKTILLLSENVARKNAAAFSRVRHPKLLMGFWRASNLAFNIFVLSWVITGSYWIYSVYHQVVATGYFMCNIVLYKFSFSFVTCSYVLSLLIFSWTFFLAISALRRRKTRARSHIEGSVNGTGGSVGSDGGTRLEDRAASAEEGGVQTAVGVAPEGAELEAVLSVVHVDSNVGVEFEGVIPGRGVASIMEDAGIENAITAAGLVPIRVQGMEQVDYLTRSSPQLYHDPSLTSHPSVTMASSPNLNCDPVVTSAPSSRTDSSPHLSHNSSATSAPFCVMGSSHHNPSATSTHPVSPMFPSPHLSHDPSSTTAITSSSHLQDPSMTIVLSPHLSNDPSSTASMPSSSHEDPSVTMVSSPHLGLNPSSTAGIPPSPHLHQDPSATIVSSPHFGLDPISFAGIPPPHHDPSTTIVSLTPHLHHHFGAATTPSAPTAEPSMTAAAPRLQIPMFSLRSSSLLGSNDSGLVSNPPRYVHTLSSRDMRRMVSCSAMHGPVHKDIVRHHSIPSLCGSRFCDMDPRHVPGRSGDSGNESNRSSLYNTVHAEGYSITAV